MCSLRVPHAPLGRSAVQCCVIESLRTRAGVRSHSLQRHDNVSSPLCRLRVSHFPPASRTNSPPFHCLFFSVHLFLSVCDVRQQGKAYRFQTPPLEAQADAEPTAAEAYGGFW